jgi:hypothetical protein
MKTGLEKAIEPGGVGYKAKTSVKLGSNTLFPVKRQPNNSLQPNAYRRDFRPSFAGKGFGQWVRSCWPGIG